MSSNNNNNNNNNISTMSSSSSSNNENSFDINLPNENLVQVREQQVVQSVQRIQNLYPHIIIKNKSIFNTAYLSITAFGCIFGDIGTSPLYVFASMFDGPPNEKQVIGSLSLILWALIMVVSVKYAIFILNADNNGEGGIIALVSLLPNDKKSKLKSTLTVLALCGSSFILGDGVITPAISLLSAVEGLEVGIPGGRIDKWIIPITIVILLFLFAIQSFGTEIIGIVCGPIMTLWFFSIGIFGLIKVIANPIVFKAFNPWEGIQHFLIDDPKGFLLLGTVILCVTGCEALYADLGHAGKTPIRLSWFAIALPCLMLNYLGQGALYLEEPNTSNPFFQLISKSFFWPMIVLATLACVIASQSLISGSFSIINQAISLKFFPPLKVKHTSKKVSGQIYIAEVNYALGLLTLLTVIGFKHSKNLIGAYGLGVSMVMVATTIMYIFVLRLHYRYSLFFIVPLGLVFFIMDGLFFSSCVVKIPHGGWYPIVIGIVVSTIMLVWRNGRNRMVKAIHDSSLPLSSALEQIDLNNRCDTCAVFMAPYEEKTPLSLIRLSPFLTHMPYPLFFVSIHHLPVPFIQEEHRIVAKELVNDRGVFQVSINYGYAEVINIPLIIRKLFIERIISLNPKCITKIYSNTNDHAQLSIPPTNKEIKEKLSNIGYQNTFEQSISSSSSTATDITSNGLIEMEMEGLPKVNYFLSRLRCKPKKNQSIFKRVPILIFDVLLQISRSESLYYGINDNSIMEIGNKIQI